MMVFFLEGFFMMCKNKRMLAVTALCACLATGSMCACMGNGNGYRRGGNGYCRGGNGCFGNTGCPAYRNGGNGQCGGQRMLKLDGSGRRSGKGQFRDGNGPMINGQRAGGCGGVIPENK